jgi:hypothetical protein
MQSIPLNQSRLSSLLTPDALFNHSEVPAIQHGAG